MRILLVHLGDGMVGSCAARQLIHLVIAGRALARLPVLERLCLGGGSGVLYDWQR